MYTRILFWRTELFEVCKFGFMAESIGNIWCVGLIPTDRLDKMHVPFEVMK